MALLVPALFAGGTLLLAWLNVSDLLVLLLSVWLLAGCLSLSPPPGGAAEELAGAAMAEELSARLVAPLFYYALFGVPGAIFYRAVGTVRARGQAAGWAAARLENLLGFIPV